MKRSIIRGKRKNEPSMYCIYTVCTSICTVCTRTFPHIEYMHTQETQGDDIQEPLELFNMIPSHPYIQYHSAKCRDHIRGEGGD